MKETKLRYQFVPQFDIEQIKGNEGSYFYFYPFINLVQRNFLES